jgi:hypothetical protein
MRLVISESFRKIATETLMDKSREGGLVYSYVNVNRDVDVM